LTSHRGLSGTNSSASRNNTDGTAAEANIHRQLDGPIPESTQLTKYASRIPITMASWLIDTSRPRIAAGDISAM